MHENATKEAVRKFMNRGELFEALDISYATGRRYLTRGILKPDLYGLEGWPYFYEDCVDKHKQSILEYRARIKAARMNAMN